MEGPMNATGQNRLERSLSDAATDPSCRPQFYQDLLTSDLFVIQEGPPPSAAGRAVLESDQQVALRSIEWNGKPYIPVFTSPERIQAVVQEEVSYVGMKGLELLKMTRGADLLLNPGFEHGKELTNAEVQSILDGSIFRAAESQRLRAGAQVMLGQPSTRPDALLTGLTKLFARSKEVKRAYLAQFYNPAQDDKPHTIIGIEVSGNWDKIAARAGIVVQNVKVPDPPVDFVQITGKGSLDSYFLKECRPFYRRKILGVL
jgi:hypothetical protein